MLLSLIPLKIQVNGHPSEMGNFKRSPVFGSSENLDTTLHEDTVGTVKSVLSTILSTMHIF